MKKGMFSGKYVVTVQYTCDLCTDEQGKITLEGLNDRIKEAGGIANVVRPLELVNNEEDITIELGEYDEKTNTTKVYYKNIRFRAPVFIEAASEQAAKALAKKKIQLDSKQYSQILEVRDIVAEEKVITGRNILTQYQNFVNTGRWK